MNEILVHVHDTLIFYELVHDYDTKAWNFRWNTSEMNGLSAQWVFDPMDAVTSSSRILTLFRTNFRACNNLPIHMNYTRTVRMQSEIENHVERTTSMKA